MYLILQNINDIKAWVRDRHINHVLLFESLFVKRSLEMDMNNGSMPMMMQMSFYFGYEFTLLFSSWMIKTKGELVAAIVGMFLLGVLLEGIKVLREYLSYMTTRYSKLKCSPSGYNQLEPTSSSHKSIIVLFHALQALLQLLQVSVAYLLMLAVMTYNGWMFLAVVFGTSVGYLTLGWVRYVYDTTSSPSMNDCH